jgi:hypothetical protein
MPKEKFSKFSFGVMEMADENISSNNKSTSIGNA